MEEFDTLTSQLKGEVKFLYFHLMGEPFLHAQLPQFVKMAKDKGFVPVLTTNGTLLSQRPDMLDACLIRFRYRSIRMRAMAKPTLSDILMM